jgi:hypothetical protein
VVPGKQEPGKIAVTLAPGARIGGTIEILLDASGSRLQKLGTARRIDVAKQTLTKSVTGEKLVVLITDGDESCGGDAAGLDKPVVVLAAGFVA